MFGGSEAAGEGRAIGLADGTGYGVTCGGRFRTGKRRKGRRKSRGRSRGRLSGKNILNLRHPHLLMSGIFSIDL